jgi:hypothetical protein
MPLARVARPGVIRIAISQATFDSNNLGAVVFFRTSAFFLAPQPGALFPRGGPSSAGLFLILAVLNVADRLGLPGRGCLLALSGRILESPSFTALSDQMLAAPLTVVALAHEQSVPIF